MPGNNELLPPPGGAPVVVPADPPTGHGDSEVTPQRTRVTRRRAREAVDLANYAERQARTAQHRADALMEDIDQRRAVSRARIDATNRLASALVTDPRVQNR